MNISISEPVVIGLITLISGLIAGSMTAFIAPHVSWGIEKKRLKREQRTAHIQAWRDQLDNYSTYNKNLGRLRTTIEFSEMRPYLSDELVEKVLRAKNEDMSNSVPSWVGEIPSLLLEEIAQIEKDWGLV